MALLLSVSFWGCTQEETLGEINLSSQSLAILPDNASNLLYHNGDGDTLEFSLLLNDAGFETQLVESDAGFIFGGTKTYADLEYRDIRYESNRFTISYYLYVDGSNAGSQDLLSTSLIANNGSVAASTVLVDREANNGSEDLLLAKITSIDVQGQTLNDVFEVEEFGRTYYYAENQGLEAFTFDGAEWWFAAD
ncbi:hypothetical protein [Pontibacter sp. G13]|uniref:hypothetical protein n=1 Tax=Pontibacter sp. G13 TaxID=3074898 RepID=UPI00288A4728|nr:hypothetical protein [Pontibacter sp. G13]WNJ19012.1 hypothetical protein RJD25_00855 [Pontibacter sp. G13]